MGKIRCAVKWGLNILNAYLTSAVVRSSRGVSGRAWPLRITNPCRPRYFGARWFSRRLTEYATRRTHMHDRSQGSLESPKTPTQRFYVEIEKEIGHAFKIEPKPITVTIRRGYSISTFWPKNPKSTVALADFWTHFWHFSTHLAFPSLMARNRHCYWFGIRVAANTTKNQIAISAKAASLNPPDMLNSVLAFSAFPCRNP
jgi:hypothetical protein